MPTFSLHTPLKERACLQPQSSCHRQMSSAPLMKWDKRGHLDPALEQLILPVPYRDVPPDTHSQRTSPLFPQKGRGRLIFFSLMSHLHNRRKQEELFTEKRSSTDRVFRRRGPKGGRILLLTGPTRPPTPGLASAVPLRPPPGPPGHDRGRGAAGPPGAAPPAPSRVPEGRRKRTRRARTPPLPCAREAPRAGVTGATPLGSAGGPPPCACATAPRRLRPASRRPHALPRRAVRQQRSARAPTLALRAPPRRAQVRGGGRHRAGRRGGHHAEGTGGGRG